MKISTGTVEAAAIAHLAFSLNLLRLIEPYDERESNP
jgi:hypothetical protein